MSQLEVINTLQKPMLERVQPIFGSSITVRKFTADNNNSVPIWHYHPEIELVFITHGSGKRQIGNHMSYYNGGDLIMIGSNVPHYGFTDRLTKNNTEVVLQFKKEFIGNAINEVVEFSKINALIERSLHGLSFSHHTREKVSEPLQQLALASHFNKLVDTLRILQILAEAEDYDILNAEKATLEVSGQEEERLKNVYEYVSQNFQDNISLEVIASLTNMTVPSFCRYFKKQTEKTFTQFVNEFRVIHACKLLSETPRTVADICFESGFNNFSHFNKHFKQVTGKSPSAYRAAFKRIIS